MIDLTAAGFADSACLRELSRAGRTAAQAGIGAAPAAGTRAVTRPVTLVGLRHLLPMDPTREQARAATRPDAHTQAGPDTDEQASRLPRR